jgi:hypothetical protein
LELKSITDDKLIKEIPVIVMLNKQDLEGVIDIEDFELVLEREKLWFNPQHELYNWNPMIYDTCALYGKDKNIYRSFYECARRTVIYQIYGDGKAPKNGEFPDKGSIDKI